VSRDPSENILICWFTAKKKLIKNYYQLLSIIINWKQLCCFTFLWKFRI